MLDELPGVHAAPNIQTDPEVYELENQAVDPEGLIEGAMWAIAPWQDRVVLDLGCGTGFHLPRFAERARHVFGVEPHGPSRLRAMGRIAALGLEQTSVLTGSAEYVPLRDHSVDVCHARFAYFFPPNCAPGLSELARVLRPGGTAFIIDNDLRVGTFAAWLGRLPEEHVGNPAVVEAFWADHGFACQRIASEWRFASRADLEAVVRLEFGEALSAELLADHSGLSVDYHYCLYYRQF
ncbi:MAG TPA: class I SAM-dependent methyltransferase [Herpetosiphonaceae bacterium]|nr:class I SAM-dependent methyltransferase [Herpetosiphonaceae bacterium]